VTASRRAVERALGLVVALVGVALALAVPAPAGVASKTVLLGDDFFDPRRVTVAVGGAVTWDRPASTDDRHNVREDGRIFRSGDPTADDAFSYTVVFSAGTFHYYCEVHGGPSGGMAGVVRVPVTLLAAPSGLPFTVRWATAATRTGDRFDVQFRVGSGPWRAWRQGTSSFQAVFGKDGRPVRVKGGATYTFRARSLSGSARSRWSPPRSFTP
jgi:plastocyanin